MMTIQTFGRYPTLEEMKAYYARDDVLEFLYEESQMRNLYTAFRKKSWGMHPTSQAHLREIIDDIIQNRIEKAYKNPPHSIRLNTFDYLSFHTHNHITAGDKLIGFDLVFEVDLPGWRRSFEALSGVIRLLDDFEVCYRMKYSGVRSLHLIIPFEALPKQFNGESILSQHEEMRKKIRIYFQQHCGMKRACGTQVLRMAYSLNEDNGLVSLPLTSEELLHFRPWQAQLHNVAIDKPWHGNVPAGAWRKTLRFLRAVEDDRKPKKQIHFGFSIVPKIVDSHHVSRFTLHGLAEKIKSDNEAARVEAAWHLMTAPDAVPVDVLKARLEDENPDVRWYLTEALQKDLNPETLQLATKMFLDNDQFVRISAGDAVMLAGVDSSIIFFAPLTHISVAPDLFDDIMYVIEQQLVKVIMESQPEPDKSAPNVAGQKVAQIVQNAINVAHPEIPVGRWVRQILDICPPHHIEPISLFLPTIQLCLRKLSRDTNEMGADVQPYVSVLEIHKSEFLPLLTIHATANALSIHDLEIPTNSHIRKRRPRVQPVLESILGDFSLEEKTRILIRFVLHGQSRASEAAAKLLMRMDISEPVRAMMQSIAKNAWFGSVNRLRQTEPYLEGAIAEQIYKGTQTISQLSEARSAEAIIDSLQTVSILMTSLRNQSQQVRRSTAKALAWMEAPTQEVVPALIKAVKNEDFQVRHQAVDALGKMGGQAVVPVLIEALGDSNKSVRSHAIFALSQIGQPAVPALIDALHKEERRIPSHAALALGKIGDATAVPELIEALSNPSMIFNATQALGDIGDLRAVPVLIPLLNDQDPGVRRQVTAVLEKIGTPEAKQALEAFHQ